LKSLEQHVRHSAARHSLQARLACGILVLSFLGLPALDAQTSTYTVIDLGALIVTSVSSATHPGVGVSHPRSVNASGLVVGWAGYEAGTNTRAVLWTSSTYTNLGTLPGGEYSAAFGINDLGQVVGTSNTTTAARAFLWTADGGMRDLGTLPGDSSSEAFGINNRGDVVGSSSGPNGIQAVRWTSVGIQALGTLPGGRYSRAFAINALGQVVGTSSSAQGLRAVQWTPSGQIRDLGTLPGDRASEAVGVNLRGQVVGYSLGPKGTRAVLWDSGGRIRDLGTLPGGNYSRAFGINDAGQVVGTSFSPGGMRAVLWSSSGTIQDLNSLIPGTTDLILAQAHSINALGDIAALGGVEEDPFADEEDSPHAQLLMP
jgi:probable HAF family extracellular repeat protein